LFTRELLGQRNFKRQPARQFFVGLLGEESLCSEFDIELVRTAITLRDLERLFEFHFELKTILCEFGSLPFEGQLLSILVKPSVIITILLTFKPTTCSSSTRRFKVHLQNITSWQLSIAKNYTRTRKDNLKFSSL
jgi:hypothetical protein